MGGTSGLGTGAAIRLAALGHSVTIVGRDATRGAAVLEELRATGGGQEHRFVACDAFLLSSVRECVAALVTASPAPHLDVLVLSQGMATMQGFTPTAEGLDEKLALHYWGR